MKAYVLHGIGDLCYEDRPLPEICPGWALVKVLAAGICSSDIPRIFEKGTYYFPTVPGHEFCGRVEAVADSADCGWVGKRVGVFPLIPCKKCPSCRKGQYETCESYDYLGSRRDGGFAEYAAVPVWNLIELPDTVSDVQGALLEPAAVALHAVRRAEIPNGGGGCILGKGAVWMLGGPGGEPQGGGRGGGKGRSESKSQIVQRCGMEYIQNAFFGGEFDCVIEAGGSARALGESLLLTAPGGKLVLMGNPEGSRTLSQELYWRILRKQLTLTGTWNSSYGSADSDWTEVVYAMESSKLQTTGVVTHVIKKAELEMGLAIMREGKETLGKIILKLNE